MSAGNDFSDGRHAANEAAQAVFRMLCAAGAEQVEMKWLDRHQGHHPENGLCGVIEVSVAGGDEQMPGRRFVVTVTEVSS